MGKMLKERPQKSEVANHNTRPAQTTQLTQRQETRGGLETEGGLSEPSKNYNYFINISAKESCRSDRLKPATYGNTA
jgi:hypothetical protein